jgi:hypothetical protein
VDIHAKGSISTEKKGIWIPIFIEGVFTIAKLWNKLRCPTTDG